MNADIFGKIITDIIPPLLLIAASLGLLYLVSKKGNNG